MNLSVGLVIILSGFIKLTYASSAASPDDLAQYRTYKAMHLPELDKCHWQCPFTAARVCGWDQWHSEYKLFLNHCFLHLHNSCFETEFVPLETLSRCQNSFEYSKEELDQLSGVLFGFRNNEKPQLRYGRV